MQVNELTLGCRSPHFVVKRSINWSMIWIACNDKCVDYYERFDRVQVMSIITCDKTYEVTKNCAKKNTATTNLPNEKNALHMCILCIFISVVNLLLTEPRYCNHNTVKILTVCRSKYTQRTSKQLTTNLHCFVHQVTEFHFQLITELYSVLVNNESCQFYIEWLGFL